jgi:hypothetical protein
MLTMIVFATAGFGAIGVWSGLALGAAIGSACGLWRLRSRSTVSTGLAAA